MDFQPEGGIDPCWHGRDGGVGGRRGQTGGERKGMVGWGGGGHDGGGGVGLCQRKDRFRWEGT